jgi:uncharacterized membrane protein YeaQ/YmgE (transglycosylase-associated protein family)
MWLIGAILFGMLAGFIASKIVSGSGQGLLMDLIIGVVGSVLGGWIFMLLGLGTNNIIGQLIMAVAGAVVLLLIVRAIKRK